MRVAVVGTRGIPGLHGGVERHCEEVYPRIAAMGHEVTVFARQAYVPEEIEWRGVRIVPLPSPTRKSTEALVHTARAVMAASRLKPDILHVHAIGPGGLVPLARALGMRTVLTVHAFDYTQAKWGRVARTYLRTSERLGARTADAVIAVAKHIRDDLERRLGVKAVYIPNGPSIPARVEPRADTEPYALFVGRLIPDKRVEDLVAASVLGPALPVVVAGGSSHTDEYEASLLRDVPENVRFVGYKYGEELAGLFANAAAFVLPSVVEGLPMSLLEAMAYGLPCIAADIPANREVLEGVEGGALFPPYDVPALRRALDGAFALGEAERARSSEQLRRRIAKDYDWDAIAEATIRTYESIYRGRDSSKAAGGDRTDPSSFKTAG